MATIAEWAARGAPAYDVNDPAGEHHAPVEYTELVTGANGELTYVTTTANESRGRIVVGMAP